MDTYSSLHSPEPDLNLTLPLAVRRKKLKNPQPSKAVAGEPLERLMALGNGNHLQEFGPNTFTRALLPRETQEAGAQQNTKWRWLTAPTGHRQNRKPL